MQSRPGRNSGEGNVRFGSLGDIGERVRKCPLYPQRQHRRPLSAKSGPLAPGSPPIGRLHESTSYDHEKLAAVLEGTGSHFSDLTPVPTAFILTCNFSRRSAPSRRQSKMSNS